MTSPHPLEKFPGLTSVVVLPLTGTSVVIRRLDVQAFTMDAMRAALSLPALREVANAYAAEAAEASKLASVKKGGKAARPRGELPAEVMLEVERQATRAMLRAALLRPSLDELMAVYGGSHDSPDLGMADDYSTLSAAVDAFSSAKAGEAAKEEARTFLVPAGGDAVGPG